MCLCSTCLVTYKIKQFYNVLQTWVIMFICVCMCKYVCIEICADSVFWSMFWSSLVPITFWLHLSWLFRWADEASPLSPVRILRMKLSLAVFTSGSDVVDRSLSCQPERLLYLFPSAGRWRSCPHLTVPQRNPACSPGTSCTQASHTNTWILCSVFVSWHVSVWGSVPVKTRAGTYLWNQLGSPR